MRVLVDFKMATDGVDLIQFHGFGIKKTDSIKFLGKDKEQYCFTIENPDVVTFVRSGSSPLHITFVKGEPSQANFTTTGINMTLEVQTKTMVVESNRLEIVYNISDGEVIFSKHHLQLFWNQQRKE